MSNKILVVIDGLFQYR